MTERVRLVELPIPSLERIFEMLSDLTSANRASLEGFDEALRLLRQTEEGQAFRPRIDVLAACLSGLRSEHVQMQLSVGALIAEGRRLVDQMDAADD
jgi:hypothetical protein